MKSAQDHSDTIMVSQIHHRKGLSEKDSRDAAGTYSKYYLVLNISLNKISLDI